MGADGGDPGTPGSCPHRALRRESRHPARRGSGLTPSLLEGTAPGGMGWGFGLGWSWWSDGAGGAACCGAVRGPTITLFFQVDGCYDINLLSYT